MEFEEGEGVAGVGVREGFSPLLRVAGGGHWDGSNGEEVEGEEVGAGAGAGGVEAGEDLPDDPLLEEFFPRGSRLYETLFFRVGDGRGEVLPFRERVRDARDLDVYVAYTLEMAVVRGKIVLSNYVSLSAAFHYHHLLNFGLPYEKI